MQFDQFHYQSKTKSGAGVLAGKFGIQLCEWIKEALQIFSGNSNAGVPNGEHKGFTFQITLGLQSHAAAIWSELHGVGEQVHQYLFQAALVARKHDGFIIHGQREF